MVSKRHKELLKRFNALKVRFDDECDLYEDRLEFDFCDLSKLDDLLINEFKINELIELLNIPDVYNDTTMMEIIDSLIVANIYKLLPTLDYRAIEDLRNNVFGLYSSEKLVTIIDEYVDSIEKKETT